MNIYNIYIYIHPGGGFKYVYFHPYLFGKIWSLTSIFFKWVGSTTTRSVNSVLAETFGPGGMVSSLRKRGRKGDSPGCPGRWGEGQVKMRLICVGVG